ncbi:MAG: integrase core domain-containing protein [Pyrinomonadaceae bacterium]
MDPYRSIHYQATSEALRDFDPSYSRENTLASIRRECLELVIVFSEKQLRRILRDYFPYYHQVRSHQSLGRNSPVPREVDSRDAT